MSEKRKQIILSFKSIYGNFDGKDVDKRIKQVKWQSTLNVFLIVFTVGFILFGIITDLLGYHIIHWEKSGILIFAIISLSSILRLPKSMVEIKLLKHYRNIQNSNLQNEITKRLDDALETEIDKLNTSTTYKILLIVLALLLLLAGLYIFIKERTNIWQYLKIPFMVFYILGLYYFYTANHIIQNNITKYEKIIKTTKN